ncbi:MAG TPA: heme biosynthesis HemY N-terminal domain-containing protein [Alphaproteobacteria bacterium]|nr:heme biosynthesis HemY N-terminal domain-containing protein [Alphaproteobacteria bacterium]
MIRALWFVAKLAVLVAIVVWFAEHPGQITVDWLGWHVETSFGIALLLVLLAVGALGLLYRLWLGLLRLPRRWRRRQEKRRQRGGLEALNRGLAALVSGDGVRARSYADKAATLLGEQPVALLSAQAAQMAGDQKAAKAAYARLADQRDTQAVGLQGLIQAALAEGDEAEAQRLAEKAQGLRPRPAWLWRVLFDLAARRRDWHAAETALAAAVKAGSVDAADGARRRAQLLLAQSRAAEQAGDLTAAAAFAKRASRADPDFAPALATHTRLLGRRGYGWWARRRIEAAWTRAPHPDLAASYLGLWPEIAPLDRMRRAEALAAKAPDRWDSHMLIAEAAMQAQLWGTARNHLNQALRLNATARALRLMGDLERAEHGNLDAARDWWERAAGAAEAGWRCRDCGAVHAAWEPECSQCGGIATMAWTLPPAPALPEPAAQGAPALPAPATAAPLR